MAWVTTATVVEVRSNLTGTGADRAWLQGPGSRARGERFVAAVRAALESAG